MADLKNSNNDQLFAGTVQHTLDDNHRVTVPARWRFEGLTELFAVPDPRQPFLILLPGNELQKMISDLESNQSIDPLQRRQFARQLFSRATPCPLDKQGRLVLPYEICASLGFRNEVLLAGGGWSVSGATSSSSYAGWLVLHLEDVDGMTGKLGWMT